MGVWQALAPNSTKTPAFSDLVSWVRGCFFVCGAGGDGVDNLARVVIITTVNSKQVIKMLEADGWELRNVKGSHHVFRHPTKPGHISVPHPKMDLGVGLVHKLLKQAELK